MSEGFVRVCSLADLPPETARRVEVEGHPVAVVRDDEGEVHAIDDTCSHGQVSLAEGQVDGCRLECWLHGSAFDLRTGQPSSLPATVPVAVHRVRLEGDEVLVALAG